jgi:phage terminase small subunit
MDKLRPKQRKFVEKYIENGGNGTQAVIDAGYDVKDRRVAGVVSSENLAKPMIAELLEDFAPTALSNIKVLANVAQNEAVKLNANKDLLDRAGFQAVNKTFNVTLDIESNNPKAIELAQKYEEELKKSL